MAWASLPHHMICYSKDPKEGYLTKKGIEKMKSGFVKNIFGQELQEIYIEQSKRRDELKQESREVLLQIISKMKKSTFQNSKIEEQFIEFAERLKFSKGRKQYGYLQPKLKAMVDEIVDELAKDERISKAYGLWYEMRNEVLYSYMDNLPEPLPLSKQKEFKSIKNMIIKEADDFNKGIFFFEDIASECTETNTFMSSSEQENEDNKIHIEDINRFNNKKISQVVSRIFYHMGKTFENNVPLQISNVGRKIDSKLLRKLRQKKMGQGYKKDDNKQQDIEL